MPTPPRLAHFAVGCVDETLRNGRTGGSAALVESQGIEVATTPPKVSCHENQHVQQPVGEGALTAHVYPGRHVYTRTWRRGELIRQLFDGLFWYTSDSTHSVGGVSADEADEFFDVLALLGARNSRESAGTVDLVNQGGEQIYVCIGLDL